MASVNDLKKTLQRIDGKGYGAYKDIRGGYDLGTCELFIDHVQSDPYAPPSKVRLRISQGRASFPEVLYKNTFRKTALEDFLSRAFIHQVNAEKERGPRIDMDPCGQEVLKRTSMVVNSSRVEARLAVGLPAKGRRIMGRQAMRLLCDILPQIAQEALIYANLDPEKIKNHVQTIEDQQYLRDSLKKKGLIAFVGNGSMLARASGVSDRPLEDENAVAFFSPPEMETKFELPNNGSIRGMGIPPG